MTIDYKRIDVLLDLLRESLPKGSVFDYQINAIHLAAKSCNLTTDDYNNVSGEAITLWNRGRKVEAIKSIRPMFPHLDLISIKWLLETHPLTK